MENWKGRLTAHSGAPPYHWALAAAGARKAVTVEGLILMVEEGTIKEQ